MPCGLHPVIETVSECKNCFDNWPNNQKGNYTRAQCKRKNWYGKVDVSYENKSIDVINNNYGNPLVKWLES